MPPLSRTLRALATALAALLLAACGALEANVALSDAEAQALAEAAVGELEQIADGAGLPVVARTGSEPAVRLPGSAEQRDPCITVSGDVSDPDGDGVPADATVTFACTATSYRGGSASLTGAIDVSDPSATVAGYDSTTRDLTLTVENAWGDRSWRETRNGTRNPRLDGDTLTLQHAFTVVRDYRGRWISGTATIASTLALTYVADGGATIDLREPLPSGALRGSGSVSFDRQRGDASFAFEITEPLAFDANCTLYPRFTSGTVVLEKDSETRRDRTVTLTFSGCGVDPEVVISTP